MSPYERAQLNGPFAAQRRRSCCKWALLQGLVTDPGTGHVTHVLLQEGHLWGRREVVIPIGAVTGVNDGIRLNITKQQVQDLPPVNIDHRT
ncbi:MAG: hypothetical protein ACLP8X_28205 [Streptosporangiaceae bacterium]